MYPKIKVISYRLFAQCKVPFAGLR